MARKLRVEYAGACYHVINRGNYQTRIFLGRGAAEAFEKTLFQTCERFNWELSAYVIMSNHYHLALKTAVPNLSIGMKWLQGTWAMRYNRFRRKTGRPFQGRYKAILLSAEAVAPVTSYIHLNPHRAAMESVEQIGEYRWSSLTWYRQKNRPACLNMAAVLSAIGGIKDSPYAHKKYLVYLKFLAESEPDRKALAFDELSKGWCQGSKEFKEDSIKRLSKKGVDLERSTLLGVQSVNFSDLRGMQYESMLSKWARKTRINLIDLPKKKSAPEKVLLASLMKQTSSVSNGWLAERLSMGQPASVSQFVRRMELKRDELWKKKEKILSIVKT